MSKFEMKKLIDEICNNLNEMYESGDFDNSEKILAVFELVKNNIKYIATMREEFFMALSEAFEEKCIDEVNIDYGWYEGLIVALCGGVI